MKSFPKGFLWGTASAAHQVEGGNRNSDWWDFEHQPGRIANGDSAEIACDHYNRYREDFALLREMNQNAHRLSVEWARIEPTEGVFEPSAFRHYRDVLGELRGKGITPLVTLHHFTNPLWFVKRGGWAASGASGAFLTYVHRVIEELGELIGMWCTINEPNIFAASGWITGDFPPGRRGDLAAAYRVTSNLHHAHELSYRAIKKSFPDAQVGLSHHKFLFLPATQRRRDRWATKTAQAVLDRWPVGAGRMRKVVETTSDFIGIAHYWGQSAAFDSHRPQEQFVHRFNVPGVPVTDMGFSADPSWMRIVLNELRPLGKPVFITENGLATNDDEQRSAYLDAILSNVHQAIEDGADVRGYFHWTNMDNFEWARGYAPKFGLISVDRKTLERTIKPSGRHYAGIAKANSVP